MCFINTKNLVEKNILRALRCFKKKWNTAGKENQWKVVKSPIKYQITVKKNQYSELSSSNFVIRCFYFYSTQNRESFIYLNKLHYFNHKTFSREVCMTCFLDNVFKFYWNRCQKLFKVY